MDTGILLKYVATDDSRAYFANVGGGISESRTFVIAYDLSNKQLAPFPNGTTVSMNGRVVKGVIDLDPAASPLTGKGSSIHSDWNCGAT